jgi:hypothetical protein
VKGQDALITENQEISCLWLKNKRCAALICGQGAFPGAFADAGS